MNWRPLSLRNATLFAFGVFGILAKQPPPMRQSYLLRTFWRSIKWLLAFFLGVVLTLLGCNGFVEYYGESYTFYETEGLPENKVGLVLGTSPRTREGYPNRYFQYRIDAAVRLYRQGKIRYILVSGDNGTPSYNEPDAMMKRLVAHGVPREHIILDYAGFRTLDSVIRSQKVFGQNAITVISQPFHTKRAVFIARNSGIRAIGYNARDVEGQKGYLVHAREFFARVKAVLDVFILDKQPKYLGEKIPIGST